MVSHGWQPRNAHSHECEIKRESRSRRHGPRLNSQHQNWTHECSFIQGFHAEDSSFLCCGSCCIQLRFGRNFFMAIGWLVSLRRRPPRALLHHTIHPRPRSTVRPDDDHSPPTASRGQRGLGCQNYAGDLNALPLRVPCIH